MKKSLLLLLGAAMTMSVFGGNLALNGKFTINAAGKQVSFSQGNLTAATNDGGVTWTWGFAERQWYRVGNTAANTKVDGDGHVSENGSFDLFSWSTGSSYYGIKANYGDAAFSGDFIDWGKTIGTGWFTLSAAEWKYLFCDRDNATALFSMGTVAGMGGLIILPDDWTLPTGATFIAAKDTSLVWDEGGFYKNVHENSFDFNIYTAEQWSTMEEAGAVFLPLSGCRSYTNVTGVSTYGYYWASTAYDSGSAYHLYFSAFSLQPQGQRGRNYGYAVRLVAPEPQVGDLFKVESFGDSIQFKVKQISPETLVEVTKDGHVLQEGTDLVIPASVNYLGREFSVTSIETSPNFAKAKTLALPNSLSTPVKWWQANLSSLEAFVVSDANPLYSAPDGVLYSRDKTIFYRCPVKRPFTTADFQSGITKFVSYAFYQCSELNELSMPTTTQIIEPNVFGYSSIKSVYLPKNITSVSDGFFRSCLKLESVDFENAALVSFAWNAFIGSKIVSGSEPMKIVDSVVVKFTGDVETLEIPEGVVNVANAFLYGNSTTASKLTTVILPSTLRAFDGKALVFGSGDDQHYSLLNKVICKAEEVPTVFGKLGVTSDQEMLFVAPCGHAMAYMASGSGWNPEPHVFTAFDEELFHELTLLPAENGEVAIVDTTECNQITITATPNEHYDFVTWSDGNTDATRTIELTSDSALSAEFALQKFHVTVEAEHGRVDAWYALDEPADLSLPIEYGTVIYLTATPDEHYLFDHWTNYDPETGLEVVADVTVTAHFVADPTGMGQVSGSQAADGKFIKNGQLYILRDGKVYNVQGLEIRD